MPTRATTPEPEVETEYGVRYPNGSETWGPSGAALFGYRSGAADAIGRAGIREEYRRKLLGVGIEPDESTSLTFVTRKRTITYSDSQSLPSDETYGAEVTS